MKITIDWTRKVIELDYSPGEIANGRDCGAEIKYVGGVSEDSQLIGVFFAKGSLCKIDLLPDWKMEGENIPKRIQK